MLTFPSTLKVYLSIAPADMRKSYTGLYALVSEHLGCDPLNGALYVFTNRTRSRLKIFYWDGSGMWIWMKRLEKGTFNWPRGSDVSDGKLSLSPDALALLLSGIDMKDACRRPWYQQE